jgi:hypothetical protein
MARIAREMRAMDDREQAAAQERREREQLTRLLCKYGQPGAEVTR